MKRINGYIDIIKEGIKERKSAGLAIIWQGQVLLAHTTGRKFTTGYGIPKGGIEPGESELEAAIRECYEEVGLKVSKNLIEPTRYTYIATSRKHKYNKVVVYFIVQIDSLEQIGLSTPVVPKSQLQIEEVNDARFMDREHAFRVTMESQIDLLNMLSNKGLLR